MRDTNPGCPNFLNEKDSRFRSLQHTLDSVFHKLHSEGVGAQVVHTETVTKEDEATGVTTPKTLQNAAFYGVGKMFALRGGIEHRSLKLTQLKRLSSPDRYVYYENVSKNRNGSFKKINIKSKVVPVYACPEAGERCLVYILDKYISKLPSFAVDKDVFYVRPLHKLPIDSPAPWYAATPVGRATLHKNIRLMCQQAGIHGNKRIIV